MLFESNAKKAKKIMDDVFGTNENDVNAANTALCLTNNVENNKKVIKNIRKIFGKSGAMMLLATSFKTLIGSDFYNKAAAIRKEYKNNFKANFYVDLGDNETFKSLSEIQNEVDSISSEIAEECLERLGSEAKGQTSKIMIYSSAANTLLNNMKKNVIEITPLGILRKDKEGNTHIIKNTILYPLHATISAISLPINSGLAAISAIKYALSKDEDGSYAEYKKKLSNLEKQLKEKNKLLKKINKKGIKLGDNTEIKITDETKKALESLRKECVDNFGDEAYTTDKTSTLQKQKQRFANYMDNWKKSYEDIG